MLFIFLLLFPHAAVQISVIRDFSTTERAPFSAQAGIFSDEEMGPVFPMGPDTDFEEARAAMRLSRGGSSFLPEAKPPGFEPQPPGVEETPEYRQMLRNTAFVETNIPAKIDCTTTAPVSYGELPPVDNAIHSFNSEEVPAEQEESSGEQRSTTIASHVDVEFSSPDPEGSGQSELTRNIEKVSGEVGQYPFDERSPSLLQVTSNGQQRTSIVPIYSDVSYDGYSQPISSQPTSRLPDTDYGSVPQYTASMTAESNEIPQNAVLGETSVGTAPQTTVLIEAGYGKAAQSVAPPDATYGVEMRATGTPVMESYDGIEQASNYDALPQTHGYEGVGVNSAPYDEPYGSARGNTMITGFTSPEQNTEGPKQPQDVADSVKEKSGYEQAVLNAPFMKKVSGAKEAVKGKKNKEDADNKGAKAKSAVIGPPAGRAPPRRGAVEGCPEPALCAKNCFVYINDNGCQDCQCLWQALACDTDDDCPEPVQYCDLGKCNCRPGMRQDMMRSGFCEQDPYFKGPLPPADIGQFAKRTKRAAMNQPDSSNKHASVEIPTDARTIYSRARTNTNPQEVDDPTLNTVMISRSSTSAEYAQPPAPPPSSSKVSRILINRSIASTFPYLPALQPLPKLISTSMEDNSSTNGSKKDIKNIEKWLKRKSIRLSEFPISARFVAARSRGAAVLPPLPLGVHPTKEELRRHNQFKANTRD